MIPKTEGSRVEFFVIQPLYKQKIVQKRDELGFTIKEETNKFVKEVWLRVSMDKNEIGPYGEYVGTKGQIIKNRTMVFNKTTVSYYKVGHSIDEIKKAMQYTSSHIGYNNSKQ